MFPQIKMANRLPFFAGDQQGAQLGLNDFRAGVIQWGRTINQGILPLFGGDWGEFFDGLDMFYPVRDWPIRKRQLLYRYKNNPERFELWLFLWLNGLPATTAGLWVMSPHYDRYDGDAFRQMHWLIQRGIRHGPEPGWDTHLMSQPRLANRRRRRETD